MTPEKYALLKERDIEIVSVSSDRSKKTWKNNSEHDNIVWTNLYAGDLSQVLFDYEIRRYPTKIVFDRDFNVIPFSFSTPDELLELGK